MFVKKRHFLEGARLRFGLCVFVVMNCLKITFLYIIFQDIFVNVTKRQFLCFEWNFKCTYFFLSLLVA